MPRVKTFDEEQVLDKALNLFWTKGYHATSIQDLVSHLGINRASLYDTFGDKKKLFDRAFQKYREHNRMQIEKFLSHESDVRNGILNLFELSLRESEQDKDRKGCFVVNSTTELIPGDKQIEEALDNNRKIFENIFYQYLLKGQKEGQIGKDKDLKSIATLLFTLYNGLKVVAKIRPDKNHLMQGIHSAIKLLD